VQYRVQRWFDTCCASAPAGTASAQWCTPETAAACHHVRIRSRASPNPQFFLSQIRAKEDCCSALFLPELVAILQAAMYAQEVLWSQKACQFFASHVENMLAFSRCGHFCKARFAGLSPWFAPVRGGGGLHFALVCCVLCIFASRSTPNKLLLTAIRLFRQGHVAT
jgi:hypothetical protein